MFYIRASYILLFAVLVALPIESGFAQATAPAAKPAETKAATPAPTPPAPAKVEEKKPADSQPSAPNAVSFKANDVWEVDIFSREDHKVLVIQDRRYTKAGRFELGVHAGVYNNTPFLNTTALGGTATYWLNEYVGIEGFVSRNWNSSTADKDQFDEFLERAAFSSVKEYREPIWFGGLGVMWAPIYGKFAFFRKAIIHFDIYGQLGVSMFNSTTNVPAAQGGKDQNHLGSLASVGMRVFLSKHWSTRLDVRHNIFRAEYAPRGPASDPGAPATVTRQAFQFTLGGSFIF